MIPRMTTQTTRTTDTLAAAPADFAELDYSPAYLMPAQFGASITSHPEYVSACESGFDCYFNNMCQWNDDDDLVVVSYFHSRSEVAQFVIDNLLPEENHLPTKHLSHAWKIGFILGWLSALDFTNHELALLGLDILHTLFNRLQNPKVSIH